MLKELSNYIKALAKTNKLVAHQVEVNGERRETYFRMNDDEELISAATTFNHSPCVVFSDMVGRLTGETATDSCRKKYGVSLVFLSRAGDVANLDDIESAYSEAEEIMMQFISRMWSDYREQGLCGIIKRLDLATFNFEKYGPVGSSYFGWVLAFGVENPGTDITRYDASNWNPL